MSQITDTDLVHSIFTEYIIPQLEKEIDKKIPNSTIDKVMNYITNQIEVTNLMRKELEIYYNSLKDVTLPTSPKAINFLYSFLNSHCVSIVLIMALS